MSESNPISQTSVKWLEKEHPIDRSFIDEVPLVPEKMIQANGDLLMGNAVNQLFECKEPTPFALFAPFAGYKISIRRLFKNKVLATFDPEFAKEILDNFFDSEGEKHQEQGEKLYEMLDELDQLNAILEEIYLKILSCLKP